MPNLSLNRRGTKGPSPVEARVRLCGRSPRARHHSRKCESRRIICVLKRHYTSWTSHSVGDDHSASNAFFMRSSTFSLLRSEFSSYEDATCRAKSTSISPHAPGSFQRPVANETYCAPSEAQTRANSIALAASLISTGIGNALGELLNYSSFKSCCLFGPIGSTLFATFGDNLAGMPPVSSCMRRCSAISRAVFPPSTARVASVPDVSLPADSCCANLFGILPDWPTYGISPAVLSGNS